MFDNNGDKTTNNKNSKVFGHLKIDETLKKPININFIGGVLSQTVNNNTKSLCLIEYPVANLSGRISIKVLQFKKGSHIIIGAMTK